MIHIGGKLLYNRSYAFEQAEDNYLQDRDRNDDESFDIEMLLLILFRRNSNVKFNCVTPI